MTTDSSNNHTHKYFRGNPLYTADSTQVIGPTHLFQGSVKEVTRKYPDQPMRRTAVVDGAIEVHTVDNKTYQAAKHYFSTQAEQAALEKNNHSTEFYLSIGASVIGVGLGIGSIFIPIIGLSIAGVAAGVGLTALGIANAVDKNSAMDVIANDINALKTMKSQWKDPVQDVVFHRQQVGMKDKGFQYVYNNNLKGTAFHKDEVHGLWLQNFAKLLSCQQSIGQMCSENILNRKVIEYAWENSTLPDLNVAGRYFSAADLQSLTLQFDTCRTGYLNFESAINNEFKALSDQKNTIKQEINHARNRWLLPAQYSYNQEKQAVESLYNSSIAPFKREKEAAMEAVRQSYQYNMGTVLSPEESHYKNNLSRLCAEQIQQIERQYSSHPGVINIENAYRNDIRTCDFLHTQSKLVVNAFFDKRLRQLETAYSASKMKIQEQQNSGNHQIKKIMDNILAGNGMYGSTGLLPTVSRNWSLPNLANEPSWNDVYARPNFQSSFSSDVSELAWNYFWSGQGLGSYASYPTSSWSGLNLNRHSTHNQWFNLRSASINDSSHRSYAGMFRREVRVPHPPLRNAAPRTEAGSRTATGFGGTVRRDERPAEPKVPVGTRDGKDRENTVKNEPPKATVGSRTATGFGGTVRR